MLVMMKHPLHGRLAVYSISEVQSNQAAGWVVDQDAPENKKPIAAQESAPIVSEAESAKPVAKKAGLKSFLAGLSEDEV